MKKGQKHSPETIAKMRAAKLGNKNQLGHSVSLASRMALAKGNRPGKRMNPASLGNLNQYRPAPPNKPDK